MNAEQPRLIDFVTHQDWCATDGHHIFKTRASAEWFLRKHRPRLIASGQFLVRRGSAGSLVGPRFDQVVLEILREESARAAQEVINRRLCEVDA